MEHTRAASTPTEEDDVSAPITIDELVPENNSERELTPEEQSEVNALAAWMIQERQDWDSRMTLLALRAARGKNEDAPTR